MQIRSDNVPFLLEGFRMLYRIFLCHKRVWEEQNHRHLNQTGIWALINPMKSKENDFCPSTASLSPRNSLSKCKPVKGRNKTRRGVREILNWEFCWNWLIWTYSMTKRKFDGSHIQVYLKVRNKPWLREEIHTEIKNNRGWLHRNCKIKFLEYTIKGI
jgi:hypothetical protein